MTTQPNEAQPLAEAKKIKTKSRSAPYPSFTFENALKAARKIKDEFTSLNFIPQDAISKCLQMSGGNFLMLLSSCVQYGLLELKKGEGYKPTPLLGKIVKPLPDENIEDFFIECLMKPELYKKLFAAYKDNQLPSESGLANTLDRLYGVIGNSATTAAKIFFKNMHAAKLISSDNILRVDSYLPYVDVDTTEDGGDDSPPDNNTGNQPPALPPSITHQTKPPIHPPANTTETIDIDVILDRETNLRAKVVLPVNFTDEHLKKVIKNLTANLSE